MMIIDTHCHLNDERLLPDVQRIVDELESEGVESVICVGYDLPSSRCALQLADKFDKVYCAVGVHPHDSKSFTDEDYAEIVKMCAHPKTVAVGEIGLDYYYDLSDRQVQKEVFARQLLLAKEVGLPVVLHVRDAYQDAYDILLKHEVCLTNGVLLHCYSGSAEMVKSFEKFDAYFAFGGPLTFKNARKSHEAIAAVSPQRLLFETDCPYLAPVPYRGKTNEPKFVKLVASEAARVLAVDETDLIEQTTKNAKRLFFKMK